MRILLLIIGFLSVTTLAGAADPVLELRVGDVAFTGRPVAYDDETCWLAQPDGSLSKVAMQSVSGYRKIEDNFECLSALEARNQLRKELGPEWEIVGTGHYLVCAGRGRGRAYADHFEDFYRSFCSYFRRRSFHLPEPEFPLIAMVFSKRSEFAQQCRRDGIPVSPGLRGYYHRHTNRINVYEEDDRFVLTETSPGNARNVDAAIQSSLKDTIVHESTHQVAFNLGLHARIGQPPKWTVEGLATMLEAEGTRTNTGGKHPRGRVNEERLRWFGMYREKRREPGALISFICSEELYKKSVLDFYAEAWALTFFLAETRPREYATYLKLIADRDPLEPYGPGPRVYDFQTAFGSDLGRLEVDMLRFIDDL